jgi:hypothetical protein
MDTVARPMLQQTSGCYDRREKESRVSEFCVSKHVFFRIKMSNIAELFIKHRYQVQTTSTRTSKRMECSWRLSQIALLQRDLYHPMTTTSQVLFRPLTAAKGGSLCIAVWETCL